MEQYCVAESQVVIPHANAWPPPDPPPLLDPEVLVELLEPEPPLELPEPEVFPEPEPPPDDEVAASPVPPSPFPVPELEHPATKATAAPRPASTETACELTSFPTSRAHRQGPRLSSCGTVGGYRSATF
jgi:protein TonB